MSRMPQVYPMVYPNTLIMHIPDCACVLWNGNKKERPTSEEMGRSELVHLTGLSGRRIALMTSGGIVAIGDSITNGHGYLTAGVPAQSWGQWLAEAMDLPFTKYAKGGATSSYIVAELLPRVRGTYAVGLLGMGTNDALQGWDTAVFRDNLEKAVLTLTTVCDRVAVLTVPTSAAATTIIRDVAARHGLAVVEAKLESPRELRPDGIHPTAIGYLTLADRAATALGVASPLALASQEGRGKLGAGYLLDHYRLAVKHAAKRTLRRALSR